jgi:hypothetical protein
MLTAPVPTSLSAISAMSPTVAPNPLAPTQLRDFSTGVNRSVL